MPLVRIDPKALSNHSLALSDITARFAQSTGALTAGGQHILSRIREEIERRRRIVREREQAYQACLNRGKGGCDELHRRLTQARQSLEAAERAQRQAEQAVASYRSQTARLSERVGQLETAGQSTLAKLSRDLADYSAFGGIVSPALLASAAAAAVAPTFAASTRAATAQSYQKGRYRGREVLVFDHPTRSAENAIVRQGSARQGSFHGTCGLCASGSVIRKAGGDADEGKMIDFASSAGLCHTGDRPDSNGGTSARNLVEILSQSAGLAASCSVGEDADSLAAALEQGRGVILGIAPSMLNPAWYGPYSPHAGGHWVVLESVLRDPGTKEIVAFVIVDSNGDDAATACQTVDPALLMAAHTANGGVSVITDDPIW